MSADNRRFLVDAAERLGKTFLQGFLAAVTLDQFSNAFDPSFKFLIGTAGMAGIYSVLMSLASKQVGAPDSASALPADVDPPQNP